MADLGLYGDVVTMGKRNNRVPLEVVQRNPLGYDNLAFTVDGFNRYEADVSPFPLL